MTLLVESERKSPAVKVNGKRRLATGSYGVVSVILIAAIIAMFGVENRPLIGVFTMVAVLGLMALGVPVGAAMGIAGLLGVAALVGFSGAISALSTMPFEGVASWQLSVIPLFILMGMVLFQAGITTRLYNALRGVTEFLPGGLAVTTNFAGAGLASVSGSTVGVSYAMGRMAIPEMLKSGYAKELATGSVLVVGILGAMIPPSILLVIYAGAAGVPVGPQLMASLVPGVLLTFIFAAVIIVKSMRNPTLAPKDSKTLALPLGQRFTKLIGAWPIVVLMIVILGGLYTGIFTATEAGAAGALVAILLAALHGRGTFIRGLGKSITDTVVATSSVFFLLVGATILNRALSLSGVPRWMAEWAQNLPIGTVGFLLLLIPLIILLGMFMEPIAIVLLTVPVLMPALVEMDVSLIWFGVYVCLLAELSVVTPPVGVLVFIIHRMAQNPEVSGGVDISLGSVFKGAMWFIPAALVFAAVLVFIPELVEWLPSLMGSG